MQPEFPEFKAIELEDRDAVSGFLKSYDPETSELTFTNLFIWRDYFKTRWSVYREWLVVTCEDGKGGVYGLPPIGPPGRAEVVERVLDRLHLDGQSGRPSIQRADARLASELEGDTHFAVEPVRDQFDYVYRTEELIKLEGRRHHAKRNHLNQFLRSHDFTYSELTGDNAYGCAELLAGWCRMRHCEEDPLIKAECEAAHEALFNADALNVKGGVIAIAGKVEAFALGEMLNGRTAVIHIEKANFEMHGLYAAINQQFCEKCWQGVPYINREQDLGEPGLRQAKLSYDPDRLVEKYIILPSV